MIDDSLMDLLIFYSSINNKLQNPEAANGVLVYALHRSKVDYVCTVYISFHGATVTAVLYTLAGFLAPQVM